GEELHGGFEVIGDVLPGRQYAGIVLRQAILLDESMGACGWQFRQIPLKVSDPVLPELQWDEIGIRKIAVVMRLFLGSHDGRLAAIEIPQTSFLRDRSALAEDLRLALDFVLDGILDELEGIDVFQFNLDPVFPLPGRTERKIGLTPKAALFHVAVTDVQIHED